MVDGTTSETLWLRRYGSFSTCSKLSTMKNLLTLTALLISSLAMGQFPISYNPDDNADGLIGVVDLQGLLANYGSEFASAIVSEDGESALVYVGEISHPPEYACNHMPGFWQLARLSELTPLIDDITDPVWLRQNSLENDGVTYNNTTSRFPVFFPASYMPQSTVSGHQYPLSSYSCYCAAKQLPRVEYSYCRGTSIVECATSKVEDGWIPLGGMSFTGDGAGIDYQVGQAFWRWAE